MSVARCCRYQRIERRGHGAVAKVRNRDSQARVNLPVRVARAEDMVELRVPVPDRPGVIAEVTTLAGELGINIYDFEIAHSAEGDRGVLVMVVEAADSDRLRAALAERGYHPSGRPLG